jgi:hypothetical protein
MVLDWAFRGPEMTQKIANPVRSFSEKNKRFFGEKTVF